MLSKTPFRIAGAAMLGTVALLGTNAANALIDLDSDSKSSAAATYAMETITSTVAGEDGNTYYVVSGAADSLDVKGEVGVGGTANSVLIMELVFDGMVFTDTSSPTLRIGGRDCSGGELATKRGGGGKGEGRISFIFTRTNDTVLDTTQACLEVANMGVAADGGGVALNVSDNLPLPATNNSTYSAAVRLAEALDPTVTKETPVATVTSKFLSFADGGDTGDDPDQVATVGSLAVAADTELLNAANGTAVGDSDLFTATDDEANGGGDGVDTDDDSSVIIRGDFSYASLVSMVDDVNCDAAGNATDLRMDEEDEVRDTTRLKTQPLGYVDGKQLCISVLEANDDDAVAIPETAPYLAMVTFAGGTPDAKYPAPDTTYELGLVDRDGTTVRLPYLTTNDRFNQRIYIVNRGVAADYVMSFHGDGDEAGMDAEGVLMGSGATTILSLQDNDVVTIGPGRTSTSGTIIIEAQPNVIDVATSQINRELGTSDTVVYDKDD